MLQNHEMRIEANHAQATIDLHGATANYAQFKKPQSGPPNSNGRIGPANSRDRGRSSYGGRQNSGSGRGYSNNNKPVSQLCGRTGHKSKNATDALTYPTIDQMRTMAPQVKTHPKLLLLLVDTMMMMLGISIVVLLTM
uniref:Uncharacterized protein n=1 Tax=Cannabis sativa TaxID=3483 RepID=A0A803QBM8_CANSA